MFHFWVTLSVSLFPHLCSVQVFTDLWEWSPPPPQSLLVTAAVLPPPITCHTPSLVTTPTTPPPPITCLAPPPMAPSSRHISTRRSCTSTGITTIPGYQVLCRSVTNCLRHICIIPGAYKRLDNDMLTTYYDRDRSKSKSPKPMFYKSPSPQRSHWGGYFWLLFSLVLFDANIYRIVIQIFDSSMNAVTALNPSELNASSERYRIGWLIVNLESLNLTPLW